MKLSHKSIIVLFSSFIFIIIFSGAVLSVSVGSAPGIMNIGGDEPLDPGTEYTVPIYLMVDGVDNPILVELLHTEAKSDWIEGDSDRIEPENMSQQRKEEWIDFVGQRINVDPDQTNTRSTPETTLNYNREATMELTIPEDAEPGYHVFDVKLDPDVETGPGQGVTTVGVTRPTFIFQVPGEAIRDGRIEAIAAERNNERAEILIRYRNTGTVTKEVRASEVNVYDEEGYHQETLSGGSVRVPPNSAETLSVYWDDDEKGEVKDRRIEATVDYTTDRVTREDMVSIPRYVEEELVSMPDAEMGIPYWLIILIVGSSFLIVYYYW